MSGRARGAFAGQAMVEFALVGWFSVAFIFAICAAGLTLWQKATLDHQLTTMADELPDGWESTDKETLAKELILDGSSLDADRLTVSGVTLSTVSSGGIDPDDDLARALNSTAARREEKWLEVSCDVEYDATSPVELFGKTLYKRHVEGSYLLERLYEVF